MKRGIKRLFRGTTAFILAGSLLFQGAGSTGQVFAAEEKAVLFEEGFESGTVGKWSGKEGANVSIETENPKSGKYCMKISGRAMPASGAKIELGDMLQSNQRLTVSAYVRYADGPEKKKIQITMFCDGKYYMLGGRELTRNEWGEISGGIVVPSDVDLSSAIVFFETPWTSEPSAEQDLMDIYVDDVKASLIPFCDISDYPALKELYKDQFLVGLAVPDLVLNTPAYSDLFLQQFNSMTMENEMKPSYILDEAASKNNLSKYKEHVALNFNSYKTGMEYAKQHGIAVRGHTLVWHSQTPEWFFYENYDTQGQLADRELMLKRMENYIKDVIEWTETNYPGVIYAWDVVNEAVADYFGQGAAPMRQEDSLWYQVIGEDFAEKAFAYARKYTKLYAKDRDIKLFYNDYNEYFPAKRDGIVALLKPIKEAGNIDGVGMQSHFDTKRPLEGDSGYMTAVRKFRDELGLELHVTELDIGIAEGDTRESQGQYYQEFMEALLKEKRDGANITSVTFWGLTDGLSWRAEEQCLLFDDDLSRKPAFEGVVNAIGNTGNVMDSINSIGKVELTKECKAKIEAARSAYDALTDAQKALVPNEVLKLLEDAETEYQRLEESKIESVVDSINSIGKVELTKECKAKIEAARSAYDALTDAQKALVPSEALKLLEDAETEYQRLEEESETPPIPPIVEKIDIRQEYISAIPAQIYSGAALTPNVTVTYENKTLVKNVDYTVNYKNNTEIGTATIVITGTGDYSGTVEKNFTITVRKNQVYVVGNYKYKITNAKTDGKGKVMLTGVKNKAQKKKLKKINVAAAVEIGGKSFKVTAIGDAAFKGFTKATKIVVGKNVTTIGSSAFLGCTRAKSIVVGENVTTIGSSAFSGCTKVVSATVGNKVTKIGAKAFYKCKNLKKIVIKGSKLKSIGKNAIKGINKKAVIKCPKKMVKKYKKLWKTSTGYKKTMKINS
ncbi:endo-1,4-beta-xylanase [Lachnospiraceae bacterium 66-29]